MLSEVSVAGLLGIRESSSYSLDTWGQGGGKASCYHPRSWVITANGPGQWTSRRGQGGSASHQEPSEGGATQNSLTLWDKARPESKREHRPPGTYTASPRLRTLGQASDAGASPPSRPASVSAYVPHALPACPLPHLPHEPCHVSSTQLLFTCKLVPEPTPSPMSCSALGKPRELGHQGKENRPPIPGAGELPASSSANGTAPLLTVML